MLKNKYKNWRLRGLRVTRGDFCVSSWRPLMSDGVWMFRSNKWIRLNDYATHLLLHVCVKNELICLEEKSATEFHL